MTNSSYRIGVIGLGRIAYLMEDDHLRVKPCTHVGAWSTHENVQIVAGCDADPERRELFQTRYPETTVYESYQEMLEKEELDIVSITAYATERGDMVITAAEAGVKGIWCEKAMATSLEESDRMAKAIEQNNVKMVVSYMRRWDARHLSTKQMIDDGSIGKLESINVHFSGNMLHTGTHAFDVLRMFAGEAVSVQAWLQGHGARAEQSGYRYGGEVIDEDVGGFSIIEFESGIRAVVHGDDKRYFRFETELLGDGGMIRVGNTQEEYWSAQESSNFVGFKELKQDLFGKEGDSFNEATAWRLATEDLLSAIECDTPVACDVYDGRGALAIALAMHESHSKGNKAILLSEQRMDYKVLSR